VLALSKADLVTDEGARAAVAEWRRRLGTEVPVIATSSATGAGLSELAGELLRHVVPSSTAAEAPAPAEVEELAEHMVFRPAAPSGFRVERLGPRSFAVRGRGIERLLLRYDVENDDAMAYVEERLRRIGVLKALEAEGFQPGDEIEIAGMTLELDPGAA